MERVINKIKGSIAFIDDYTAWIDSPIVAKNLRKIRLSIIPHLKKWAQSSAAIFNGQKLLFIHFTRTASKADTLEATESLSILGASVAPSLQVKILGVIFNQKLNFQAHIAWASQKGVDAALTFKKLKNLYPETARRLCQAKIVPVVDYASPIWSPGLSTCLINKLNVPLKIGGQAVIGDFGTMAGIVAESEAGLEPPAVRLYKQPLQAWLKWHAKPSNHRFWNVLSALDLASTRLISPLQKLALKFRQLSNLSNLEKFEAFIQPPWLASVPCMILSRDKALFSAQNLSGPAIFTDSSAQNGHLGIGIHSPNIPCFLISSATVATTITHYIISGKLFAIDIALAHLISLPTPNVPQSCGSVTLFTDSHAALNALNYPTSHNGQFLVKSISLKFHQLKSQGIVCSLQWSPAHSKIPGNMQAHNLAQLVTLPNVIPPITNPILLFSVAKQNAHAHIPAPDPKLLFIKAKVGRFIKSFDKALPGKHTITLYNGRKKKHSQILCQLRTGICRLNPYLAKIQAVESGQCRCNRGSETVDHILFRCLRWSNLRQEFKRLAANRWDDLSHALGGWSNERKDGPLDKWSPQTAMVSATINFALVTCRLEDRSDENNNEN